MGHGAIVGTHALKSGSPPADNGLAVACNLPLVFIPLPALVVGLLLAVGAF